MNALLNIGLAVPGRDYTMQPADAIGQLKLQDMDVMDWRVDDTGAEPTVVAYVERASHAKVYAASVALSQDCIAVYNLDECLGSLDGPKAADWGTFDPRYFRVL